MLGSYNMYTMEQYESGVNANKGIKYTGEPE